MFTGMVGIGLPSAPVQAAGGDETETEAATRIARTNGARYAAVFAGFDSPHGDLVIDLVDARSGAQIAKIRVPAPTGGRDHDPGADAVLGILRAIAPRDSLFPQAYRSLLQASGSGRAIMRLVDGQRQFAQGDFQKAREAFNLALAADSTCLLAAYRLSTVDAWNYDLAAAYETVEAALRRAPRRNDSWTRLLHAQRLFTMRFADSAIAAFGVTVADDPYNFDGWFGLSQAMYYLGWVAGHSLADAKAPLERVLALDAEFDLVRGKYVDAAIAAGDTAAARTALAGVAFRAEWRPAKDLLVRYATASRRGRDSLLSRLDQADSYTLSELVLQLSRAIGDIEAADRVAAAMQAPRLPIAARRRAAGYRLVLSRALGREPAQEAELLSPSSAFNSWVGAAVLAGVSPEWRNAVRAAARGVIPRPLTAQAIADPSALPAQAIEYLVQDALLDPSAGSLAELDAIVESARPLLHRSEPMGDAWRATLDARAALARADTASAIAFLRQATRRPPEPYGAFYPLASLPTQRHLLLKLLRATGAAKEDVNLVASSFRRSWSIADALYTHR